MVIGAMFLVIGCRNHPRTVQTKLTRPEPPKIIVTINDQACITADMFLQEMAKSGGHVPGRFADQAARTALLEEMIGFEVLASHAEEQGYGKLAEVERARKAKMVELYLADLSKTSQPLVDVSDDEVKKYYEDHRSEYEKPPMRRASLIAVPKPWLGAKGARQKAEKILSELRANPSPSNFRAVAIRESGDERTRSQGGDLGWLTRGENQKEVDDAVETAIWSLEKRGQLSNLIEGGGAYYMVLLTGVKTFPAVSFEQARDRIRFELKNARIKEYHLEQIDQLRREVKIAVDEDLLESLVVPGADVRPGSGPPTFPVGAEGKP